MEQVEEKQLTKLETRIALHFDHLKDIIQHSHKNKNIEAVIVVHPSRFRKILSDYYALNGIFVEGALDNYAAYYPFFVLSELDDQNNNNTYKIVKNRLSTGQEYKAKCEGCDCGKKRWVNPETKVCYYKEMINNNYNTKMK